MDPNTFDFDSFIKKYNLVEVIWVKGYAHTEQALSLTIKQIISALLDPDRAVKLAKTIHNKYGTRTIELEPVIATEPESIYCYLQMLQ